MRSSSLAGCVEFLRAPLFAWHTALNEDLNWQQHFRKTTQRAGTNLAEQVTRPLCGLSCQNPLAVLRVPDQVHLQVILAVRILPIRPQGYLRRWGDVERNFPSPEGEGLYDRRGQSILIVEFSNDFFEAGPEQNFKL